MTAPRNNPLPRITPEQLADARSRLPLIQPSLGWDSTDWAAKITNTQLRMILSELDLMREERDANQTANTVLHDIAEAMGLSLVNEKSGVRPQSLSYIKPSEMVDRIQSIMRGPQA